MRLSALALSAYFATASAQAQLSPDPSAPQLAPPDALKPEAPEEKRETLDDLKLAPSRRQRTSIEVPGLEDDAPPDASVREDVSYLPGRWAGFWVAFSNHGMTRSLFKASGDEYLLSGSKEKVLGLGLQLDVALSPVQRSSFRLRGGYMRSTLSPGKEALGDTDPGELENTLNLFHLGLISRKHLSEEFGEGIWWGGGVSIQYAFSTSTGSSTEVPASKLKGSTAIAPLVAVGMEIPFPGFEEFFAEADWVVFKGYSLLFGFRTSL